MLLIQVMYPRWCIYTANLILVVGIVKFATNPCMHHLLLVVLGITSVRHHSRLHTWWLYDTIAMCDRIAVLMFVAHSLGVYKDDFLWRSTLLLDGVIIGCNWLHIIKAPKSKIAAHAGTHLALIAALLYIDAK